MSETSRQCTRCFKTKEATAFYSSCRSACKECLKAAMSARYVRIAAHVKAESKRRRVDAPVKEWARLAAQAAKGRAKKLGVPFELDREDIIRLAPTHCPILELELDYGWKGSVGPRINSPTVDRIHGDDGYVLGNVAVISHKANRIKNDATLAELEAVVTFLRQLYGNTHDNPHS